MVGEGPEGIMPYEALPPPYVKMHSQYFREAGYFASNNAKEDYQFRKPVTAWDESGPAAHWRNKAPGQPFFSVFNLGITHESQVWEQQENPLLISEDLEVRVPPYLPTTEVALRDVRQVYSNIVALDLQVGRILAQLEEDGLADSTIVFFFSDHGGPLPRQKRMLYDSGLHLPMIIRFPDRWHAGSIDDQLISFVDFKSTILSLAGIEPPDYSDGRAFLGEFVETPKRQYVHAAADRFDNQYDTIRAVRDSRYKYLRNYNLDQPYYLPLPYREQMPIMQELLKLNERGDLTDIQSQWFRLQKPLEELFDTDNDPHELHNLAGDRRYEEKLSELGNEMNEWLANINDLGFVPERELIASFWPQGRQPITEPPVFSINENSLSLISETEGASIGYQVIDDNQELGASWKIYQEPIRIEVGQRLIALAHRIGFVPSKQVNFQLSSD
jgi:arylsulfatase A-like enzyme